jgi:cysteine desulfurase
MGFPSDIARSTIRVSLGWSTTEADINHFIAAWTALYRRRHGRQEARAA